MRNPFICAALTKQRRKSHRMCWRGEGSGFGDDTEPCQPRWAPMEGLVLLPVPPWAGMESLRAPWASLSQTPNSPSPCGSRLLLGCCKSCSGTETCGAFLRCLRMAPAPESPGTLVGTLVGGGVITETGRSTPLLGNAACLGHFEVIIANKIIHVYRGPWRVVLLSLSMWCAGSEAAAELFAAQEVQGGLSADSLVWLLPSHVLLQMKTVSVLDTHLPQIWIRLKITVCKNNT